MKKLILLVSYLLLTIPCMAEIIIVDDDGPADFNNIQAAINDANDGDTVLVADGTYTGPGNRDIDFLGKAITVRSSDPEDPCVVAATVIDCENIPNHRGFYFHSDEGPNSVLSGFTIKGGRIEQSVAEGGGILCDGSSPTIEYCTVTENTVISTNSDTSPQGALILPIDPNTPITIGPGDPIEIPIWGPNIPDLLIPGGTSGYAAGGGICIKGGSTTGGGIIIINPAPDPTGNNPTIYKCRIVNNKVEGANSTGQGYFLSMGSTGGGGIACMGGSPVIIDCLISNNTARGSNGTDTEAGGAIRGGGVMGGGSPFWGGSPVIIDCLISNNTARGGDGIDAEDGGSAYGAGIYGPATVINSVINNNTAYAADGGNAYGAGIYKSATVINSIINSNTAYAADGGDACGGAVYATDLLAQITLINCTISKNTAVDGGIIVCRSFSTITNCILWDNIGSPVIDASESIIFHSQDSNASTISISYNDVEGAYPGTGNIDADPCFVNPDSNDFHLLPNSPCINAGDPNFVIDPNNNTDLDGNPRIAGGRIDMGAYESVFHQAQLWLRPRIINKRSRTRTIIAWIYLPHGISRDQVDIDTPLTLYPGGIEAQRQYVFQNHGRFNKRTRVLAFFNSRELLNAVDTNGPVQMQAIGCLREPGQYFIGSNSIMIINPQPQPQLRRQRRY